MGERLAAVVAIAVTAGLLCACQPARPAAAPAAGAPAPAPASGAPAPDPVTPDPIPTTTPAPAPPPPVPTTTPPPPPPPAWVVGAHPLPRRPDGFGQVRPTPPVLANRSLPTADLLPPPRAAAYVSSIAPVPGAVLKRSSWSAGCPVKVGELRYLTMSFWGFDGRQHTGEMIVNATVAAQVVAAFGRLHAARFPLEEMRVVAAPELDAPPTGDGNNTTAFVCRAARGQTRWSAHAYGLAVDINPFCNPYQRGGLVLPELASAYLDRAAARPGMLRAGDPAVRAFAAIGWTWGGTWTSPRDLMHFSATGD